MRYTKTIGVLIALSFTLTACYHTKIATGLPQGNKMIHKEWAHSFVYGLVPPATVKGASRCSNGVASVETQRSFLNMLASVVTLNLYTPMDIKVTCASASASVQQFENNTISVGKGASIKVKTEALKKASDRAVKTGDAVYISFK